MKSYFALFTALLVLFPVIVSRAAAHAQSAPIYQDAHASLSARVDDLFGRLTQDEKLSMLAGTGFATQPIARLGVPAMGMADAGQGVRGGVAGTQGPATLFPSEIVMASTWDPDLIGRVGQAIGEEVQNKGTGAQVLLGPDINIHRTPLGGRNGESFTEDPYLNSQMVISYVRGLQSTGAAACAKHFAANNEEIDRDTVDVYVGERALREIYLPAFKAAVRQGHVWTIMPSYNLVNGYHSTANHYLLTDVARHDWGFDGLMISDWGAVHETVGAVNAGNDLEMPTGAFLNPRALRLALDSGTIQQSSIDDAVKHILTTVVRVGLLDGPAHVPDHSVVNSPEHQALAYEVASKGVILLKNENAVLPLNAKRIQSIAVIGPGAMNIQAGAAGSPELTPFFQSTPLDAIKALAGGNITVNYAPGVTLASSSPVAIDTADLTPASANPGEHGVTAEYFNSIDLSGAVVASKTEPRIETPAPGEGSAPPAPGVDPVHYSVRFAGTLTPTASGTYTLVMRTYGASRVYLDDKLVIDTAATPPTWALGFAATRAKIDLLAGRAYAVRVESGGEKGYPTRARLQWIAPVVSDIPAAVDAARKSDVAIVFVSTKGDEGEGHDRMSMALPADQDRLIQAVAAANKRTIVVLNNGTPVSMTAWLKSVPGLVEAYFPGEQGGKAIAAILFGDVNPSGKLPDTLGARREDYPDYGNYPGTKGVVRYAEGIYVGYRHFDKSNIAPLFPFGYGLSYTTFHYGPVTLSGHSVAPDQTITATLSVTNTGRRSGAEVVELYVRDLSPQEDRPIRELKGFAKVDLQPGETKPVAFTVTPQDLAYFDESGHQWKADPGRYMIEVGASSRDIRTSGSFMLTRVYTAKP